MHSHIDQILIDRRRIADRVKALADQIVAELPRTPAGAPEPLTLVPVLTGSLIFVADLMRQLPVQMQIHLISATSYPGRSTRSQGPSIDHAMTHLPESLSGSHVLLIDDILDSGQTLRLVSEKLAALAPASLKRCVLLRKQTAKNRGLSADYIGFDIADDFVVGYGLDFDDYYRNLPDIVTLHQRVLADAGRA